MKYSIFLFALFLAGCKKEDMKDGSSVRLQFVKTAGKIVESFEYNAAGMLTKENRFWFCESTPTDEFTYIYNGAKPDTIKSLIRSLSSSSTSLCDPAYGAYSYAVIDYDNQNRIRKSTQSNGSITSFFYNSNGFIEKQTITYPSGSNAVAISYTRDAKGNLIEETDAQGSTTRYEYDDKPNPYYSIKKFTDVITAFYNSPNNVVAIKSTTNTSIFRYEYNRAGLPVKMFEPNGATYEFMYQ